MIDFEEFTTERLMLRKITPELCQEVFENYDESEICNLLGLNKEAYDRDLLKFNKEYIKGRRPFVMFRMYLKSTKEVVGSCALHNWFKEHYRAEIGYDISIEEYKRKGLMTEMVRFILDYGFNQMNLNRIEGCVGLDNIASQNLLLKMNFQHEGLLHQHYFKEGTYSDSNIFSILRTVYLQKS